MTRTRKSESGTRGCSTATSGEFWPEGPASKDFGLLLITPHRVELRERGGPLAAYRRSTACGSASGTAGWALCKSQVGQGRPQEWVGDCQIVDSEPGVRLHRPIIVPHGRLALSS